MIKLYHLGPLYVIKKWEPGTHFHDQKQDFLIDQHRHLGLIPSQSVLRRWGEQPQLVNLEQVYVRLSMSVRGGDEDWATTYGGGERSWRKRPLWVLRRFRAILPSVFAEKTYQSGDLGLVVDRHKRLVLRGHPGSGKTTLLRYLAVTCARSLRNKQKDGDSTLGLGVPWRATPRGGIARRCSGEKLHAYPHI